MNNKTPFGKKSDTDEVFENVSNDFYLKSFSCPNSRNGMLYQYERDVLIEQINEDKKRLKELNLQLSVS